MAKTAKNVLVVFYEELMADPAKVLSRIALFLEKEEYDEARILKEIVAKDRRLSDFDLSADKFDDTESISFSKKVAWRIENFWGLAFNVRSDARSYEEMYETFVGETYPFRKEQSPLSPTSSDSSIHVIRKSSRLPTASRKSRLSIRLFRTRSQSETEEEAKTPKSPTSSGEVSPSLSRFMIPGRKSIRHTRHKSTKNEQT